MKITTVLLLPFLMLVNANSHAYVPNMGGNGGGGSACAKPRFSQFKPLEKSEVKPGSEFSFFASANTHPKSIKVTVKGIPVDLNLAPKGQSAFKVTGVIPGDLKETFARINITALGGSQCKGADGWLIKIAD